MKALRELLQSDGTVKVVEQDFASGDATMEEQWGIFMPALSTISLAVTCLFPSVACIAAQTGTNRSATHVDL